jgi:hypothetical protein
MSAADQCYGTCRGYAPLVTGQTADLETFQESVDTQALTQLKLLTRDNPGQSARLRRIGSALDEVIAYSQQLVDARNAQGIEATVRFESNGPPRCRHSSMKRTACSKTVHESGRRFPQNRPLADLRECIGGRIDRSCQSGGQPGPGQAKKTHACGPGGGASQKRISGHHEP